MTNYVRMHGGMRSKTAKVAAALWAILSAAEFSTIAAVILTGPVVITIITEGARILADASAFAKKTRDFLIVEAPIEAALHVGALVLTIYFVFLGLDRIAGGGNRRMKIASKIGYKR